MTQRSRMSFFKPPHLRQALASQETLVGQHDRVLHEVVETLRGLTATVSRIQSLFGAFPKMGSEPSPILWTGAWCISSRREVWEGSGEQRQLRQVAQLSFTSDFSSSSALHS
ncbi:hypothetical protein PAMA_002840 [Pampus argenteus]